MVFDERSRSFVDMENKNIPTGRQLKHGPTMPVKGIEMFKLTLAPHELQGAWVLAQINLKGNSKLVYAVVNSQCQVSSANGRKH